MQNNKFELKDILFIIFIVVLAILAFVFTVGYIISYIDPNHSITGYSIAISFVGIFATFGGAFLGAKISGDNARKLADRDINASKFKLQLFLKKAENNYISLKQQFELKKKNNDFVDLQMFLDDYQKDNLNYSQLLIRDIKVIINCINKIIEDDFFYYIVKEVNGEVDLLKLFDIKNDLKKLVDKIQQHSNGKKIPYFESYINKVAFDENLKTLKDINNKIND
ncbi:hypothetical protein [Staphylococcus devriesei]|nr:hypothetical protein [Staphylococcus devriesei]MCE5090995.1 hypothetical protein [Staphylococcus devriesei]PTF01098.1 hypothetical protein BUY45_11610 [Staphylococcus devriesei]